VVRHRARVEPARLGRGLVGVSERGVHAEPVRHGSEIVELGIHVHPFGLGIGLDLVADHADPLRAVEHEKVGAALGDLLAHAVEARAERGPGGRTLRAEQRMREAGNDEAAQHLIGRHGRDYRRGGGRGPPTAFSGTGTA
jgi:hypothetical protein